MSRSGPMRQAVRALVCVLAIWASSCEESVPRDAPVATRPEATLRIEPPRLRIGDVVEVRISVRTPPDHHLAPWQPPEPDGAWLLGVETTPVERGPGQWLHGLRVRLRPRELGVLRWPDTTLPVVDAADREIPVALEGREFEVVAPAPWLSERDGPFGMLRAAPRSEGPGWIAVVAGAASGALFALALAWAWTRWRPHAALSAAMADGPPVPSTDLFDWAREELDAARAVVDRDPLAAAGRTARTLRAFVARRFQAAVEARTTPELAEGEPPFQARSRWPWFLRILRDLDDLRFRGPSAGVRPEEAGHRVEAALDESWRFIERTRPGRGATS